MSEVLRLAGMVGGVLFSISCETPQTNASAPASPLPRLAGCRRLRLEVEATPLVETEENPNIFGFSDQPQELADSTVRNPSKSCVFDLGAVCLFLERMTSI